MSATYAITHPVATLKEQRRRRTVRRGLIKLADEYEFEPELTQALLIEFDRLQSALWTWRCDGIAGVRRAIKQWQE